MGASDIVLAMRWILGLLVVLAACAKRDERSTLDQVLERGTLIVGTEPEFPPFESRNSDGEFVGFDMDMIRELAKDLGVKLRIEPMQFDSLPTALANGKIDLIASGMTAKEERAKSRSFTDTYFLTGLCLLVNVKAGIERPADVDGKRLVVKLGTTGDINALKLFPKCEVTKFDTEGACALEVINGAPTRSCTTSSRSCVTTSKTRRRPVRCSARSRRSRTRWRCASTTRSS